MTARLLSLLRHWPHPPQRLLEIGYGDARLWPLIRQAWPTVQIFGAELHPQMPPQEINCYPLCADGRALPFARRPLFDGLLIRHPNVDASPQAWAQILAALPIYWAGTCLLTSYSIEEMAFIEKNLPPTLEKISIHAGGLAAIDLVGADRYFYCGRRSP